MRGNIDFEDFDVEAAGLMKTIIREAIGTYGLLKEVDLEEALRRMSIEARAMNEESMRNLEKEKRRKDLMSSRRDVA